MSKCQKRTRKEDDDEEDDDKPATTTRAPKKSKLSVRSSKVNEVSTAAPAPIDVFMAESAQDISANNTNAPQQIGAFVSVPVLKIATILLTRLQARQQSVVDCELRTIYE